MSPLTIFFIHLTTNQNMSLLPGFASRIHQYDISTPLLSTERPCTIHIVPSRQGRVCVCEYSCREVSRPGPPEHLPSLIFTSVFTLTFLLSLSLCMCLLIDLVPVIGCSIEAYPLRVCVRVCHTAVGRPSSSTLMLMLTVHCRVRRY